MTFFNPSLCPGILPAEDALRLFSRAQNKARYTISDQQISNLIRWDKELLSMLQTAASLFQQQAELELELKEYSIEDKSGKTSHLFNSPVNSEFWWLMGAFSQCANDRIDGDIFFDLYNDSLEKLEVYRAKLEELLPRLKDENARSIGEAFYKKIVLSIVAEKIEQIASDKFIDLFLQSNQFMTWIGNKTEKPSIIDRVGWISPLFVFVENLAYASPDQCFHFKDSKDILDRIKADSYAERQIAIKEAFAPRQEKSIEEILNLLGEEDEGPSSSSAEVKGAPGKSKKSRQKEKSRAQSAPSPSHVENHIASSASENVVQLPKFYVPTSTQVVLEQLAAQKKSPKYQTRVTRWKKIRDDLSKILEFPDYKNEKVTNLTALLKAHCFPPVEEFLHIPSFANKYTSSGPKIYEGRGVRLYGTLDDVPVIISIGYDKEGKVCHKYAQPITKENGKWGRDLLSLFKERNEALSMPAVDPFLAEEGDGELLYGNMKYSFDERLGSFSILDHGQELVLFPIKIEAPLV